MEVEEMMRIYMRKKPEKDVTGSYVQILQIATCCEKKKRKALTAQLVECSHSRYGNAAYMCRAAL